MHQDSIRTPSGLHQDASLAGMHDDWRESGSRAALVGDWPGWLRPPLLADVTPAALAELRLEPGVTVWASFKATDVETYPQLQE